MKRFTELLQIIKPYSHLDFMVLGGYPSALYNNSKKYNDVDLFFKKQKDFDKMLKKMLEHYIFQHESDNAISLQLLYSSEYNVSGTKIQLIKKIRTLDEHFKSFDINKAKIGIEFLDSKPSFRVSDDYVKPLQLQNFHFDSFKRLTKYKNKGYSLEYKNVKDSIFNILLDNSVKTLNVFYDNEEVKVDKYTHIGQFLKENKELVLPFLDDLTFYNFKLLRKLRFICPNHFWIYVLNTKIGGYNKPNELFNKKLKNEYPEVLLIT